MLDSTSSGGLRKILQKNVYVFVIFADTFALDVESFAYRHRIWETLLGFLHERTM